MKKKHLVLAVPRFEQMIASVRNQRRFPLLEKFIARADHTPVEYAADSAEEFCWQLIGQDKPQADIPVAALMLLGQGYDPGDAYWCCVAPVHVKAEQRNLLMLPQKMLELDEATSRACMNALNICLADRGLQLIFGSPTQWYSRLATPSAVNTVPLSKVEGRFLDQYMPSGEDRIRWLSVLNDAQMCLYKGEVGSEKSESNAISANSVWLWGVGATPSSLESKYACIWTDMAFVKGMARVARTPVSDLPVDIPSLDLSTNDAENHLIILNKFAERHAIEGAESEALLNCLEHDYLAPLLQKLLQNQCAVLELITGKMSYLLTRKNLRRFWRRTKPLHMLKSAGKQNEL